MSHSTHYRSFRTRFYGSDDPTNSVTALKDDGQSTTSRTNPASQMNGWKIVSKIAYNVFDSDVYIAFAKTALRICKIAQKYEAISVNFILQYYTTFCQFNSIIQRIHEIPNIFRDNHEPRYRFHNVRVQTCLKRRKAHTVKYTKVNMYINKTELQRQKTGICSQNRNKMRLYDYALITQ